MALTPRERRMISHVENCYTRWYRLCRGGFVPRDGAAHLALQHALLVTAVYLSREIAAGRAPWSDGPEPAVGEDAELRDDLFDELRARLEAPPAEPDAGAEPDGGGAE